MKKFEYFVSYYFIDNMGYNGFGNIAIETENDINEMQISEIEEFIVENNKTRKLDNACIISYQLRKITEE